MGLVGRLKDKKGKEGLINILIAQFFLVVLLYFSVAFQDSRGLTIVGTFILLGAALYFFYKGVKSLWLNKKSGRT